MLRNHSAGNLGAPGPSQPSTSNMSLYSVPSTSQMQMNPGPSHTPTQGMYPGEQPVNLASKVAEVFLTAGHAFQKLGDLTLQLHSNSEPEECKWTEKDVDNLRDSLTRFAHELDMISQSVQGRTTKHIKTDIKRRHLMPEEPRVTGQAVKRTMVMPTHGVIPKRVPVQISQQQKPVALSARPLLSVPQQRVIPVSHHQLHPSMASTSHSQVISMQDPSHSHHYLNNQGQ